MKIRAKETSLDLLSACQGVSFLRDVVFYSNFGNENSDSGHIKWSHGPQIPTPDLDLSLK